MKELIEILEEIWRFYEADKLATISFFRSGYKYFDSKAKEKEADIIERDLNYKKSLIEQIKQIIKG